MKVNVGCGPDIREGWSNIDINPQVGAELGSITDMPFSRGSCDVVEANYILEHLPFTEEEKAFKECYRVLRRGGKVVFKVPDFPTIVENWLAASDQWKSFYKICGEGDPDFGFGHGLSMRSRWGRLLTYIFGTHEAEGKFHLNAYSEGKIVAQMKFIGFRKITTEVFYDVAHQCPAILAKGTK